MVCVSTHVDGSILAWRVAKKTCAVICVNACSSMQVCTHMRMLCFHIQPFLQIAIFGAGVRALHVNSTRPCQSCHPQTSRLEFGKPGLGTLPCCQAWGSARLLDHRHNLVCPSLQFPLDQESCISRWTWGICWTIWFTKACWSKN